MRLALLLHLRGKRLPVVSRLSLFTAMALSSGTRLSSKVLCATRILWPDLTSASTGRGLPDALVLWDGLPGSSTVSIVCVLGVPASVPVHYGTTSDLVTVSVSLRCATTYRANSAPLPLLLWGAQASLCAYIALPVL